MTYSFHPDAELELNASIDYYQECKKNLGLEFAYEVSSCLVIPLPTKNQTN